MPELYKILTPVLALTGCISLIVSGELNPFMSLPIIGLFLGYYRFLRGMRQAPGWVVGGLSILTLLMFFLDFLVISRDYLLCIAHLTITLQAIKGFDLKEPWDNLQVYFVALLQLIITSVLTHSIVFGLIFMFFLVVLITALVLSHFIKEGVALNIELRKPIIYISLLTLLSSVALFISIPRYPKALLGKSYGESIKTAGFSERVDFGSFGDVKLDPTIVMRVELMGDVKAPYYWRGLTLDYFDGISWVDTLGKGRRWIHKMDGRFNIRPFEDDNVVIQRIFLEPMDTDVVFGLGEISAIDSEGTILFMNDAGALFLPAKIGRRFNYIVYSTHDLRVARERLNRYLQLPEGLERISRLAHSITEGIERDIDKAIRIEDYLRRNYTYSLSTSPPPPDISAVEDFLFNSKNGYCEHYATSMVLMLRAIGIPSRVVTGFLGGDLNEHGGYIIVRQSNAHSWVEAVIDGRWTRFDPTPPVLSMPPSTLTLYLDMLRLKWYRYVVAFSPSDQKKIVNAISIPFRLPLIHGFKFYGLYAVVYILVPLGGIVFTVFLLRYLRLRRYGFVTAQYIKLRNRLKNKGARIKPSSTPAEVKREAALLGMDGRVSEFIRLYEEYRFGGRKMGREERIRYQRLPSK